VTAGQEGSTAGRSSIDPRTTIVAVLAVLGAAVVALVGLRALGIGQDRPPVVLIGDSITANLAPDARDELGDDWALTVDGKPGFLAAQQIAAAENAARFPFRQAVVNLGTNDAMTSDHDLDETIDALGQIVDALHGFDCVHVVTVSESMTNGTGDAGRRARRINDGLRALAASRRNVDVIDWASIVRDQQRDRGESLTTDTVHPNEAGNELLADAYSDALDACPT
jgi:hypothetical protein